MEIKEIEELAESSGRPNRRLWTALSPAGREQRGLPFLPSQSHHPASQSSANPALPSPATLLSLSKSLCKGVQKLSDSGLQSIVTPRILKTCITLCIYPRHYELFGSWLRILYLSTLPLYLHMRQYYCHIYPIHYSTPIPFPTLKHKNYKYILFGVCGKATNL